MFGKTKRPTLAQQIAAITEIYQAQFEQILQIHNPVERFELLSDLNKTIIASNEELNVNISNNAIFGKAMVVSGGFTGGVIAAAVLATPFAGLFAVAASGLYFVKITRDIKTVANRKSNCSLSTLSAAIHTERQRILDESPLEDMQSSPKFKEFVEKNPVLQKRLVAEFVRVNAPDYKQPLAGKERLPKNDAGFNKNKPL